MFELTPLSCTGFYRDTILITHYEVLAQFIIAALLTFTVAKLFNEIFIEKTQSRSWLLIAISLLAIVIIKTLIPLTGFYAEIPHYSQIDCTFNQLVYPDPFGPNIDILFLYNRLFTLLVIPILIVLSFTKILIISISSVKKLVRMQE